MSDYRLSESIGNQSTTINCSFKQERLRASCIAPADLIRLLAFAQAQKKFKYFCRLQWYGKLTSNIHSSRCQVTFTKFVWGKSLKLKHIAVWNILFFDGIFLCICIMSKSANFKSRPLWQNSIIDFLSFFTILNSNVPVMSHAKIQQIIPTGSGEEGDFGYFC